jgi:hypothetical protein
LQARPADEELAAAFDKTNREVQRRTTEYANRLDETPVVIVVWDGKPGDGASGTADAVRLWRETDVEPDIIDVTTM